MATPFEIVGAVEAAIGLTKTILGVIGGWQDATGIVQELSQEVTNSEVVLKETKNMLGGDEKLKHTIGPIVDSLQAALKDVDKQTAPYKKQAAEGRGVKGAFKRLQGHFDSSKLLLCRDNVRHYTLELECTWVLKTNKSAEEIKRKVEELGAFLKSHDIKYSSEELVVLDEFTSMAREQIGANRILEDIAKSLHAIERHQQHVEGEGVYEQGDILTIRDPAADTCSWILNDARFDAWRNSITTATLHLLGKMGCGKTVMTRYIVDKLCDHPSTTDSPSGHQEPLVLWHFCSGVTKRADVAIPGDSILRSLIHQVLFLHPELFRAIRGPKFLDSRVWSMPKSNDQWSIAKLWKIFVAILKASGYNTVYCIMDGLDECDTASTRDLLHHFVQSCSGSDLDTGMRCLFLFSSRYNADIQDSLGLLPTSQLTTVELRVDVVKPDIESFVAAEMRDLGYSLRWDSAQLDKIRDDLTKKADGMFIWVRTALEEIRNCDDHPFEFIIQRVNRMPVELFDLYTQTLKRICNDMDKLVLDQARKMLVWLLLSARPMTVGELSLALAIDPTESSIENCKLRSFAPGRFVLKHLAPFAILVPPRTEEDQETKSAECVQALRGRELDPDTTIQLVHKTGKDYLFDVCSGVIEVPGLSDIKLTRERGHEEIAVTCLSYLVSDEIGKLKWAGGTEVNSQGLHLMDEQMKDAIRQRIKNYPLLAYAAEQWPFHLRQVRDRPGDGDAGSRAYELASTLLFDKRESSSACAMQVRTYLYNPRRTTFYGTTDPLCTASRFENPDLVRRVLCHHDPSVDLQFVDLSGSTALDYACGSRLPADVSEESSGAVVRILLANGLNAANIDRMGRSTISWAAGNDQFRALVALVHSHITPPPEDLESCQLCSPRQDTSAIDDEDKGYAALTEKLAPAVNHRDPDGSTPLHNAALGCSSPRTISLLLAHGASTYSKDEDGWTPLHFASAYGNALTVGALLDAGAPINARDNDGNTPLHLACKEGNLDTASRLCKSNAHMNAWNEFGRSALCEAVLSRSVALVKFLIDHGAELNQPSFLKNKRNDSDGRELRVFTPLQAASGLDSVVMIDLLVNAGAKLDCLNGWGESALHVAASGDAAEAAEHLLALGCDPDLRDNSGHTPLLVACIVKKGTDILDVLYQHDVDINVKGEDDVGWSGLHWAARNGNAETLGWLLKKGACVDARGKKMPPPLHLAAQEGHRECCEALLNSGADLEAVDDFGLTPLGLAVRHGHPEVCDLLIFRGASLAGFPEDDHLSLLQSACARGHMAVARLLLSHGARVDEANSLGHNAVDIALLNDNMEMAEMLLTCNQIFRLPALTIRILVVLSISSPESTKGLLFLGLGHCPPSELAQLGELSTLAPDALRSAAIQGSHDLVKEYANGITDISVLMYQGEQGRKSRILNYPVADNTSQITKMLFDSSALTMETVDDDGWNILHWAVVAGSAATIDVALDCAQRRGSPLVGRTLQGNTALHLAMEGNSISTTVVERLLDTDLRSVIDERGSNGLTALHVAVLRGKTDMVCCLLQRGADPLIKTLFNRNILHLAASSFADPANILAIIQEFQARGFADSLLAELDDEGATPLLAAANSAHEDIVRALLNMGSNIEATNVLGMGVVHCSAAAGRCEVMQLLLEHGADANQIDFRERGTLHSLANNEKPEAMEKMVQLLTQWGARGASDPSGWTPYDVARELDRPAPVQAALKLPMRRVTWRAQKGARSSGNSTGPSRWGRLPTSSLLRVSEDGLEVDLPETAPIPKYSPIPPEERNDGGAVTMNEGDGWTVAADTAIPKNCDSFYFEVEIIEDGLQKDDEIFFFGIGLSRLLAKEKFPGWETGSWGYHSDDGRAVCPDAPLGGKPYAQPFAKGNTVGCGYSRKTHSIYFTRNGKFLGQAYDNVRGELFPIVGFINPGTKIRTNFHATPPEETTGENGKVDGLTADGTIVQEGT
ncbi:ankyrin repeat-containing domain protein [Echria macrotheca]|uniref:Ankyrin repeat-containing domain protein n=1 Tax=Echria macrotheca TaxID=438768 RepID=A0AAJ0BPV9_9PEZI|nr:ankyrin repeat-containing domain protein [Echria macrotheca]